MQSRNSSKLIHYTIGIVVEDIEEGSDIIKVFPLEKILDIEPGDLAKEESLSISVPNEEGEEKIILKKSKYIKAKWRSQSQYNRLTPPTIRKGEKVDLYRYSNSDIFYWDSCENNPSLRKTEKVVYAWSVKDTITEDETIENMYSLTIDTKNQYIKLFISANHKEATEYTLEFDAKNGIFKLVDGENNFIKLFTQEDLLSININKDIEIKNGNDIKIENGNDIEINNGNDIKIDNGNNIEIDNGNDIKIDTGNDIDVTASNNINIEGANNVKIKATTVNIKASDSIDLNADGEITLKGSKINLN